MHWRAHIRKEPGSRRRSSASCSGPGCAPCSTHAVDRPTGVRAGSLTAPQVLNSAANRHAARMRTAWRPVDRPVARLLPACSSRQIRGPSCRHHSPPPPDPGAASLTQAWSWPRRRLRSASTARRQPREQSGLGAIARGRPDSTQLGTIGLRPQQHLAAAPRTALPQSKRRRVAYLDGGVLGEQLAQNERR